MSPSALPATAAATETGNSRPTTAATCASRRAPGSSRSMRATSSASSAGGSSAAVFGVIVHVRRRSPPASSSARNSSSRYRGLPSALATTSSLTCSPTRPGGISSSISARAASSRNGASGSSSTRWANRVCASSRKAHPCEPGSGRNAVASITAERSVSASRRSARSRVVRSAQCRSSIASTSGRVAPSASAHSTNASCTRSDSSSADSASSSRSTSCSRRIESIRPRYGRTRSCAAPRSAPARARSLVRTASSVSVSSTPSQVRRSSTNGPYGEPAPYETQRPSSRVTSSPASDRSSASVLVLPSPASPTTSTTCPRPARRSATALASRASSPSRPTRGVRDGGSVAGRGPTRREAVTGAVRPFTVTSPSGSSTNRSPRRDAVPGPIAIEPGSAALCSLAATFVVSPSATVCESSPPTSPTAAGPLFTPTRTLNPSIPQAASTSPA